jgi:SAM-dependent methyltransferase
MALRAKLRPTFKTPGTAPEAAGAYDAVGARYLAYADGDHIGLFDFTGGYSFADREIWARLDAALIRLRTSGRHAIRILDAGCGPGTWLLRLVVRARDLGFTAIDARGIDISPEMIALAGERLELANDPHIGLTFEVGNLLDAFDEDDDASFDLTLCLYGVLNHLGPEERETAAAVLTRVTDGDLFVTVRTVGSQPSIYVAGLHEARAFRQDNEHDRLDIDLADGRHIGFSSHLFTARELVALFPRCKVAELAGIDLFHGRFAPHPGWNPADVTLTEIRDSLDRLEHLCVHDPLLIDRAAHALLHARTG